MIWATLLPLAVGMIVLNQMHATNVLVTVGLFYILAGLYFRVPVAVQPMKVIAAYAIAAGMTPHQIVASGLWMGVLVLLLGVTGLIGIIQRYTPKSTVRGIQLAVGVVLLVGGLELIMGQDPNLAVKTIGPMNTGLLLGAVGLILTLLLLENKKFPAALVLIVFGISMGLLVGKPLDHGAFAWGFHVPRPLPYGWPGWSDLVWVIPVVVLPQLPMTIGNAIISNTDVTHEYFPGKAHRVTNRSVSISQGLANLVGFFLGGIPMCHGAGGLAAHYRFGARTAGSNLYIGGILLVLALIFGENIVSVLRLLPLVHPGRLAHLFGTSAGAHDPGSTGPKGSLRGSVDAGAGPGVQSGRCFRRGNRRRLRREERQDQRVMCSVRPLANLNSASRAPLSWLRRRFS